MPRHPGLLRIATAGSVDDGKSTLIGRLLWDSKSVFEDQLAAVERTSAARGDEYTNLALLTDGLRAEREQGITIDVAYRYFATPSRRFILADTPGHVQYTRNMVTGASTADLAIVLVDARHGVVEQSRRHAYLATLLRVPHLVLAVNKMDLVDFAEDVFRRIVAEFSAFSARLGVPEMTAIPMSALNGDNVVTRSTNTPWYTGPALLEHLESVDLPEADDLDSVRFPVQYVIRPQSAKFPDYRGYAGSIASGVLRPGDDVVVLPSGRKTTVRSIDVFEGELSAAVAPQSVTLRLADDLDISRGDLIVGAGSAVTPTQDIEATVCWLVDDALRAGNRYLLKHTTRTVPVIVTDLDERIEVVSLTGEPAAELLLNDIGRVRLRTASPVVVDPYALNRTTGSFLLIDTTTGATVGAGLVENARAVEAVPA